MAKSSSNQASAYREIRRRIIHCELKPGQKLSIPALADELGYGRTPNRESLVRVDEQMLVYTVPQSGTYVSHIDLHLAENARFVREHLEHSVSIECCARATDEGIAALEELVAQQQRAVAQHDADDFFKLDNRFHEELFNIAGRSEVWALIDISSAHLERFRWLRTQVQQLDWDEIVRQHREMLAAIKARRPEDAGFLATTHLHLMGIEQDAVMHAFPGYFKQ